MSSRFRNKRRSNGIKKAFKNRRTRKMRGGTDHDLFYAIEKNDLKMVKKALNGESLTNITQITRVMPFSGKPNVNGKQLSSGNTPLMVAIQKYSNLEIVELLITNGADVNIQNYRGDTALHLALSHENIIKKKIIYDNQFNTLKLLIDKSANVNIQNKDGNTPLHLALNEFDENLEIIKLLIEKGADVNKKNINKSPLHLALTRISYMGSDGKQDIYNRFEIINLLIEKGADVRESIERNNKIYTPLDIAYENRDKEVMKLLDEKGSYNLYYNNEYLKKKDEQQAHNFQKKTEQQKFVNATKRGRENRIAVNTL